MNAFDDEEFERYADDLPEIPARRARHFFTERARVRRGIGAWKRGELELFGELMNASCRSSIENWESGSEALIALQGVLEETPGVLGSRFSGAGFGGCIVALVKDDKAAELQQTLTIPGANGRGRAFLVESDSGLRLT